MQWNADEEPSWFIHGVDTFSNTFFLHYNSCISKSSCPPTHILLHTDAVLLFLRKPNTEH